jgi:Ca-activated chloride channel homolog
MRASWLLFVACSLFPFAFCVAQDLRADLPSNGSLRIENRRGNVSVEVWEEQHVSVLVTFEGQSPQRSPVIIRRTEQLLNVLVARAATAAVGAARVNLSLRIPARSRTEIITNDGVIEMRGVPEMLDARTTSGDVEFTFSIPVNELEISARAPVGRISATISDATAVTGAPRFESGKGTGGKPVRLSSEKGHIAIFDRVDARKSEEQVSGERKPPTLIGSASKNPTLGVPATSSSEPQEVDESDVIRVDTELVTFNVSVVDRGTSRGLVGLPQSDFKVYEDGVEQQLAHFESSTAPFNLLLLIDLSGSTRDKVQLIRAAAQHFVYAARPADKIAVITFASAPLMVSPLTSDREALRQRIGTIETATGDTKLYDALDFAMNEGLKDASGSRRTAVVVMSDGLDGSLPSVHGDGSALSYKEILSRINEFDGVLYSLWVNTEYESLSEKDTQPEDFDAGHDRMGEMAEAGGGMFYEVDNLEDLAGAYGRVVADIGTVYSLSYHPTNNVRDGKWRAIRVTVARQGAIARGRRGYYAN